MDERGVFLKAIRESPEDDTLRLVFADFLEERGSGDLDTATAEFIRASCRNGTKPGRAMPPAAYSWIADNWKRLVPTLFAKYPKWYDGAKTGYWKAWLQDGSKINVRWRPVSSHNRRFFSVWLVFGRGFLVRAEMWSYEAEKTLTPLLRVDQPLAKFR